MEPVHEDFKWAHQEHKYNSWGYFVTFTREGVVRATRPEEVDGISIAPGPVVELIGALKVRDDGSCIPGDRCTIKGDEAGIATCGDRWRVLRRMDKNVIVVIFK